MAALAQERLTDRKNDGVVRSLPVKAGVKIYLGALVALNAGFAAPGATAVGRLAIGVAEETIDNTGGADGAVRVRVRECEGKYGNSAAGDAIAQADVGKDCYIVDDQTLAKTDNTGARSRAGKITQVDSDGVYVKLSIGV